MQQEKDEDNLKGNIKTRACGKRPSIPLRYAAWLIYRRQGAGVRRLIVCVRVHVGPTLLMCNEQGLLEVKSILSGIFNPLIYMSAFVTSRSFPISSLAASKGQYPLQSDRPNTLTRAKNIIAFIWNFTGNVDLVQYNYTIIVTITFILSEWSICARSSLIVLSVSYIELDH